MTGEEKEMMGLPRGPMLIYRTSQPTEQAAMGDSELHHVVYDASGPHRVKVKPCPIIPHKPVLTTDDRQNISDHARRHLLHETVALL